MSDEMLYPVYPIIDGHNDTLLHLSMPREDGPPASFFDRGQEGHLDLPRARVGRFASGMFAVFVRPEGGHPELGSTPQPVEQRYALATAIKMVATLYRVEAESEGQVKVVRDIQALQASLSAPWLGAVLHFEGADPIDTDLDALLVFYQAGLRSIGITWSRPNAFATGVPLRFPGSPDQGPGLTDAGLALVKGCNALGVTVDCSHLNAKGFWDVARISEAPLVATHSCAYALCPSPRNLSDKQLAAIAESGGIVGVNYYVGFLREDGATDPDTPLSRIVDHVEYMVGRMGIEHVGLGSDFDGALIPQELGDVAGQPKLMAALRERGYDDAALRKICHENWLRVLGETWKR